MIKKFYTCITLCVVSFALYAEVKLPAADPVPGGIAVIELGTDYNNSAHVKFQKRRVLVKNVNDTWYAIVGLPLTLKPGIHKISIGNKNVRHIEFKVSDKNYKTTYITITNERMVSPTKKDIQRHNKEKPLIINALNTWSENENVQTQFSMPVNGRFSSPFGLKRIYNKQERIRRHTGLDIAAPTGTAINSPATGRVIRTGNYFFTGNTVFIDHGQGLITMYCHLNATDVKAGQILQQNEKIGTVGMTGRVSGPHLHWVVSLNNTKVDPNLFLH